MADYYPVLKRAISAMPPSSGEARRAVYERARSALIRQLNSYNPPLSPTEISDQRMSLEECIRRVEAEVGEASFGLSSTPAVTPPVRDHAPAPAATVATPAAPAPARDHPHRLPTSAPVPAPEPTVEEPAPTVQAAPTPRRTSPAGNRISAGLSALTRTLKQADTLGKASSAAVRSAREAIAEPPEEDFAEPTPPPATPPDDDAGHEPPAPLPWVEEEPRSTRLGKLALFAGIGVAVVLLASVAFIFRNDIADLVGGTKPDAVTADTGAPAAGTAPKIDDRLPTEGDDGDVVAPDAHAVRVEPMGQSAAIDPDLPPAPGAGAAATAPAETPAATDPVAAPSASDNAAPPEPVAAPSPTPAVVPEAAKTADSAPAPDAQPGILVAQKAILYEEPIPGSPGTKREGQVLWSFENLPPLPGDKPVPTVKAEIKIPDLGLTLAVTIRKNNDSGLPASHIVSFKYDLPADFAGKSIDTTAGMIAKQTEEARGDPLIGPVVQISDSLYWLALSGVEQDADHNADLLKSREWFDIPIRYANRRRAILTFEKGVQGTKAMDAAFAAWGQ